MIRRTASLVLGVIAATLFVTAVSAGAHAQSSRGLLVVALQQPAQPAGAQDEFLPVDQLPKPEEQLPAAPLLIAAYVFVWLMLLVYVFALWRRLGKVEREITSVSRQIEEGRRI